MLTPYPVRAVVFEPPYTLATLLSVKTTPVCHSVGWE